MHYRNTFTIIDDPEDGLLELYYSSFDAVFTREDEKETLSAFKALLSMNQKFEWAKEFILLAEDRGTTIGGASWAAYDLPEGLAIVISYVHTEPFARRQGKARAMVQALRDVTESRFGKPVRHMILESEPEALAAWEAMGFADTGLKYTAPAVHAGDDTLDHLTLCYHGEPPTPAELHAYLRAYFTMSYFKGKADGVEHPQTAGLLKSIRDLNQGQAKA